MAPSRKDKRELRQQQVRREDGQAQLEGEEDVITISDDEETEGRPEAEAPYQPAKVGAYGLNKRQFKENNLPKEEPKRKRPRMNKAIAKSNFTTEDNKRYSCHICEMTFSLRDQLKNHIESGRHGVEDPSEPAPLEDHDVITISDDEDVDQEEEEVQPLSSQEREAKAELRREPEVRRLRNSSTSTAYLNSANVDESFEDFMERIKRKMSGFFENQESNLVLSASLLVNTSDSDDHHDGQESNLVPSRSLTPNVTESQKDLDEGEESNSRVSESHEQDNLEDDDIWTREDW